MFHPDLTMCPIVYSLQRKFKVLFSCLPDFPFFLMATRPDSRTHHHSCGEEVSDQSRWPERLIRSRKPPSTFHPSTLRRCTHTHILTTTTGQWWRRGRVHATTPLQRTAPPRRTPWRWCTATCLWPPCLPPPPLPPHRPLPLGTTPTRPTSSAIYPLERWTLARTVGWAWG